MRVPVNNRNSNDQAGPECPALIRIKINMSQVDPYYWFVQGRQYLIAAETLLDRIIKNGNQLSYVGKPLKDKAIEKRLDSNDAYLFFPLMLLFYHGIELFLKALYIIENGKRYKNDHEITSILNAVDKNTDFKVIVDEVKKYTYFLDKNFPEFHQWLTLNKFTIDSFYLFLRYPSTTIGKRPGIEIFQIEVLGLETKTLPHYRKLRAAIRSIIKGGVIVRRKHKGVK